MKESPPGETALAASGLPEGSFPLDYFRRALSRGRLSHAYLFVGPAGSGRRRFALELAKAIFCRRGAPCGSCPSCQSIDHGNHPDLHVYRTAEGKGSIEIAEVREIGEKIHLRRAGFVVVIIEDADRMTVPAANALLKTLEEPTGEAVLILIAGSSGGLLPTIVSRCHRIPFPESAADREGGAAPAPAASLEDPSAADFPQRDVKDWLGGLFPDAGSPREAVRLLLEALLARERARWTVASPGPASEAAADRLARIADLRADLDRNVNADLVLEAALALLRKFP
jgi:DNA polymerase III delta' subunit